MSGFPSTLSRLSSLVAGALVLPVFLVGGVRGEETATAAKAGERVLNSIGMSLRLIPAGEFLMGSTNEFGRFAHEHRHKIVLTKSYYIGAYEVTQQQYEKVVGKNPSHFSQTGEFLVRQGQIG